MTVDIYKYDDDAAALRHYRTMTRDEKDESAVLGTRFLIREVARINSTASSAKHGLDAHLQFHEEDKQNHEVEQAGINAIKRMIRQLGGAGMLLAAGVAMIISTDAVVRFIELAAKLWGVV